MGVALQRLSTQIGEKGERYSKLFMKKSRTWRLYSLKVFCRRPEQRDKMIIINS
ncbi:Hypothetical protein SMAX5B_017707 [Scophthalmus maximus]|uniref:Uncharacterized protein n=1 Tax=Scophthalmus maximus TaxID=52904 RepID=A0A2U9BXZ3_SCOMX|nr:Hypothetical protein SMAX5B_017707 [Scophthalmus maximus]